MMQMGPMQADGILPSRAFRPGHVYVAHLQIGKLAFPGLRHLGL